MHLQPSKVGAEMEESMITDLIYRHENPHNSCEKVYQDAITKRFYVVQPGQLKCDRIIYTCTPSKGYFEADCPLKSGLTFVLDGEAVTTMAEGLIRNEKAYQAYQEEELKLWRIKPEYKSIDNYYRSFDVNALLTRLYGYINPEHAEQITVKRKEVYRFMHHYYFNQ
jgi:hypothetical protein